MAKIKNDKVWCDINGNKYTLEEIDNKYLYNILRFIANGGGYVAFLDDTKIEKLYNEANKRNIKHNFNLEDLINAFHEKLSYVCQLEDWWTYMED